NDSSLKSFVTINPGSTAIIRGQSIVLQRTTNRNQPKRLVGGLVSRDFADRNPTGYVTENHTIVVLPDPQQKQAVAIETLLELLTSSIVDDCFRRVSGTVSVSTKVLRELPLPNPEALAAGFQAFSSPEEAIRYAYLETIGRREP
ncbi:SAM-dependent methyltransferase, partial [Rhizobium ruizarguesonis]